MRPAWPILLAALALGPAPAAADVLYELTARTTDVLVRGTVELEERVTISVRGDRLRQEAQGSRTVVTRRGARYRKPGHRLTLEQPDRDVRYEVNLDAGTYAEESYSAVRRDQEASLAAAERALGIDPVAGPPGLPVAIERTGERQAVLGRACERVVLTASTEVRPARMRGEGPAAAGPTRYTMTFDVCLAPPTAAIRELRGVEERVGALMGERGALLDRQLRIFARRSDVLAVFELLHRAVEQAQLGLGGLALRWERRLVGPRRAEPQAVLFRHRGEVTRIEEHGLPAAAFELPAGLVLDTRRAAGPTP